MFSCSRVLTNQNKAMVSISIVREQLMDWMIIIILTFSITSFYFWGSNDGLLAKLGRITLWGIPISILWIISYYQTTLWTILLLSILVGILASYKMSKDQKELIISFLSFFSLTFVLILFFYFLKTGFSISLLLEDDRIPFWMSKPINMKRFFGIFNFIFLWAAFGKVWIFIAKHRWYWFVFLFFTTNFFTNIIGSLFDFNWYWKILIDIIVIYISLYILLHSYKNKTRIQSNKLIIYDQFFLIIGLFFLLIFIFI